MWRDRDYDYSFLLEIMQFKLQKMCVKFGSSQTVVDSEDSVRYMRICISLIEKIKDGHYEFEPNDYLSDCGIGGEKSTLDFFKKYPGSYRKAMSDPRFSNYIQSDEGIAIATGMVRNEKARRILFSILNQKIQHWWL